MSQQLIEIDVRKYRLRTNIFMYGCYLLLFISLIAPFVGYCDMRPEFETRETWFQRSGALTTIFALLSTTLRDLTSSFLYSGGFGEKAKLIVKQEFQLRFALVFAVGFVLTVVGTIIWGYGDTILKLHESSESLYTLLGLDAWF